MQFDLWCPVEKRGVTVKNNSKTGEPYALLNLFNLSEQVVTAVSFTVHTYDANGGALGDIDVNLTGLSAAPKSNFAENKAISLKDYPETQHFTIDFHEVQFAEGEPYVSTGEVVDITIPEPDYEEKIRLTSAAGEDACCYAQDTGTHWICVCGRPNLTEAETCVRCGRNQKDVMDQFSSRDALTKTLAEQVVAKRIADEAAQAEKARLKAERIKTIKKNTLWTAIGVAAFALVCIIGYLIYGGVSILLGNHAAKQGDALKAYRHYTATNLGEVGTVSEAVRGNTNSNLFSGGYMTTDKDNLYYVDPSYNIYKESKATGETSKLTDEPGLFLNASDGWLYYLNASTGQQILRVSADGEKKETVYETPKDSYLGSLLVVGNELYFTIQEPMENMTPEKQEQLAKQGNTGAAFQYRLYQMRVGRKRADRVCEEEVSQIAFYKGRIYYSNQEDGALYSMNRRGKDIKKLVNGPLYGIEFHEDALYYLDGTVNEASQQPKLSLEKASIQDGSHLETIISDAMVTGFSFDGEDLYYTTYEGSSLSLHKKSAGEDVILVEGCQMFNMRDGYIMYVDMTGQFMKSTADKSGFEAIQSEPSAQGEASEK